MLLAAATIYLEIFEGQKFWDFYGFWPIFENKNLKL